MDWLEVLTTYCVLCIVAQAVSMAVGFKSLNETLHKGVPTLSMRPGWEFIVASLVVVVILAGPVLIPLRVIRKLTGWSIL